MILRFITDIVVFLSSTVKFALGASAVVGGNMGVSGSISSILGGITGIVIFTYLGSYIRVWLIKTFPKQLNKRFSRGSRFLVKVRQHAGLTGIAFFSHQVGSFIGAWGGGLIFERLGSYDWAWRGAVIIGLLAGSMQMLMNVRPPKAKEQLGGAIPSAV